MAGSGIAEVSPALRIAQLLTPAEVADVLRVSARTVRRYGDEGRLHRVRVGGRLARYTAASVEALIANNSDGTETTAPPPETSTGTGPRHVRPA